MRFIPFSNAIKDITSKFTKIKKQDYLKNAKYPIVDQSQVFIAGYTDDYESLENFDNEVIVFGDHTRIFKYIDFPIAIGADGVKVLQVDKKLFITKYVYYYLRFIKLKDAGYSRHFKFLKELNIPLLDIEEQKKIADLLSKIEKLLEKREKSIKLLNSLIKSTFLDMFGDPISNKLNTLQLSVFTDVQTGATPNKNEEKYYKNGVVNWIRTTEVQNKAIEVCSEKISQIALKETNCKIFPIDTILIAMYGEGKTRGQVGLLKIEATSNQACAAILPNKSFSHIFLFYQLQYMYKKLRRLGHGGARPNLNLSMIKNLDVISPLYKDNDKIVYFENIALKIENTKKIYKNSLKELKQLFNSTSQKAFKGELDLNIFTLEFEDEFPDILDEIVKEEERKNIHFKKAYKKYTSPFISKVELGEAYGHQMDAESFKNLIKEILQDKHTFEELQTKMESKNWIIPYDEEVNKKVKPFNYKDTIFELLKENQIFQKIREYEEDGELKRKILLKVKK